MAEMPVSQLREWLAYYHLEREAARDAELEASANARATAAAARVFRRGGR